MTIQKEATKLNVTVGAEHLEKLADDINARLLDIQGCFEGHIWHIGKDLHTARGYFNSDRHFGQWLLGAVPDLDIKTSYNYRILYEVFNRQKDRIAGIPKKHLYKLAQPKYKDQRDDIVAEILLEEKVTPEIVEEAIKKYTVVEPAPTTAEQAPEPTTAEPEESAAQEESAEATEEPEATQEPPQEPEPEVTESIFTAEEITLLLKASNRAMIYFKDDHPERLMYDAIKVKLRRMQTPQWLMAS